MTADTCACDAQPGDDDRQCPACGASVTGRQPSPALALDVTPRVPCGVYWQCYRAKVPGASHQARMDVLAHKLDEMVPLGLRGVAWHGFSTELDVGAMHDLTALCRARGLLSFAFYGMDSTDPAGKAERIGTVLESDVCDGVGLDAEGAWEDEAADVEHAHAFYGALRPHRERATGKLVVDQPWPLPTVHWSRFPWEDFSACVDAHCPQDYYNDWKAQYGERRVEILTPKFLAAWAKLQARLAAEGLKRPRWQTIQGYGWDDIPGELRACLAKSASEPVFVWSEWAPDDAFMRVWREWAT